MDTKGQPDSTPPKPPTAPRFCGGRLLLWLPVCLVHGALVAWAATLVERFSAPLVLFSLLVGAALGASLVGMIRVLQVGNRPTVLLGTVVAATVAVGGQHYIGYRTACRAVAEEERALARVAFQGGGLAEMPVPPEGFFRFLRWRAARGFALLGHKARGWTVWALWAADAALVLTAALGVVGPALGRPYCDRCRSWFRTTRGGPVDAQTARQLARLVEAELNDPSASARYRLLACRGGCAPALFQLRWIGPLGGAGSVNAWLDRERRTQVVDALDQRMTAT